MKACPRGTAGQHSRLWAESVLLLIIRLQCHVVEHWVIPKRDGTTPSPRGAGPMGTTEHGGYLDTVPPEANVKLCRESDGDSDFGRLLLYRSSQ